MDAGFNYNLLTHTSSCGWGERGWGCTMIYLQTCPGVGEREVGLFNDLLTHIDMEWDREREREVGLFNDILTHIVLG